LNIPEVRYYKGKYKVMILIKGKNYLVEALEPFKVFNEHLKMYRTIKEGEEFTTVPRLLWRHKRK